MTLSLVGHVAAVLRHLYRTWLASVPHILGLPVSRHGNIPDRVAPLCAGLLMELKKVVHKECC